jgi:hypothetical protein
VAALLKRGARVGGRLAAYVEETGSGVIVLRAETLEAAHKLLDLEKNPQDQKKTARCRLHSSSPQLQKLCWTRAWAHVSPLRFAVGTEVLCKTTCEQRQEKNCCPDWARGEVILLRYRENNWEQGTVAAYQVRLDSGQFIYILKDEDNVIRRGNPGSAEDIQEATPLCDIPLDTLVECFDKHLVRMRYCPDCRENVEDAFDVFTGVMAMPEELLTEEDYSVDIFAPYQILRNEQRPLLRCDPSQLPGLVARFKEESKVFDADPSRNRHAKNLREGQHEILFMLGEYFERSIKQAYHKRLVVEHEEGMLLRLTLQALRIKLEELQQAACTVVWDEEELDSNTMTVTTEARKNKKKKGKKKQDQDEDGSRVATVAATAPDPAPAPAPPLLAPMSLLDVAASLDEDEDQNLLISMGWFVDEPSADGEGLSLNEDDMAEELQNLLTPALQNLRRRLRNRLRNNFKALLHTPEVDPPAVPGTYTCPKNGAEETDQSRRAGRISRSPGRAPAKTQVDLDMAVLQPVNVLKSNSISTARSTHCPSPQLAAGSLKEKQAFARRRRT